MKTEEEVEKYLLSEIAGHEMKILLDSGVHRHLVFRTPGNNNYMFELVSWPGSLCFTGDIGTYVFSRTNDMFKFFGRDMEKVNLGYWGQKVEGQDRFDGLKKFSQEYFHDSVRNCVENTFEDDEAGKIKMLSLLEEEGFFGALEEFEAHDLISEFDHEEMNFDDFWEDDCRVFTGRYIGACFAIVWGINKYFEATEAKP